MSARSLPSASESSAPLASRCCTGLDYTVPAPALGVVVARKVDPTKFVARGMNQLAKKNRKQLAGFEIPFGPILDLPGLDGQKTWNISADGHSLFVRPALVAFKTRLKV
jgi:hypothetical protein